MVMRLVGPQTREPLDCPPPPVEVDDNGANFTGNALVA